MSFFLLVLAWAAGLVLAGYALVTACRVTARWFEDVRIRRDLQRRFPGLH